MNVGFCPRCKEIIAGRDFAEGELIEISFPLPLLTCSACFLEAEDIAEVVRIFETPLEKPLDETK